MYGFLLALLVLDGIILVVVVLLQSGKGGGLAAMGGGVTATEGVLGGRQATTFLTRATWITGSTFMVFALILAIMSSRQQQPTSILQGTIPQTTAPAPVMPLNQLPSGLAPAAAPTGEPAPAGAGGAEPEP